MDIVDTTTPELENLTIIFDIKDDLSFDDITSALDGLASSIRRKMKEKDLYQEYDFIVESISKASPFQAKLIPVLKNQGVALTAVATQLGFFATQYNSLHDLMGNLGKDMEALYTAGAAINRDYNSQSLKDLDKVMVPIAKSSNAKLSIVGNNNTVTYVETTTPQAEIAREEIKKKARTLSLPSETQHTYVVMYIKTAVDQQSEKWVGDKATIESIYPDLQLKLIIPDNTTKKTILNNAFTKAFIVDVEVQTVETRPVLYKVLELHEIIDKP